VRLRLRESAVSLPCPGWPGTGDPSSLAAPTRQVTPEEKARIDIDAQLTASGWILQDYKALNLSAGPGHIAASLGIEREDLELSPFNQRGGLGKAHQLFGVQLSKLLDELNDALAA
jgi:hypothetical protein